MTAIHGPIIPVLFPAWARVEHLLHRPLVDPSIAPSGPILGYMTEENGQVVPIAPQDEPVDSAIWQPLNDGVLQFLRGRAGEWKQEELELETGRVLVVMACEEDPFACARVMDQSFMLQAHNALQSRRLVVCMPVQGVLYATRESMTDDDLISFEELIYKVHTDAQFHPVSPILFSMEDGVISGALAGLSEADKPVRRPLPVQVTRHASPSGSYSLDILVRKTPPVSTRFSEILRVIEKVVLPELESLQFTGQATLTVNTGSGHRSADYEAETEMNVLQMRVNRLLQTKGWMSAQGSPVIVQVVHFVPDDESMVLERRSTGSLTDKLLQDSDAAIRARCAEILGQRLDPSSVRALTAALDDEDDVVREKAVDALLQIGEPAADAVETTAQYGTLAGRLAAFRLLASYDSIRFRPFFLQVMTDPDATIRTSAAQILAGIPDPGMKDAMLAMLNDEAAPVRAATAQWLTGFDADWALDGLISMLGDPDGGVRTRVRQAVLARGKPVTGILRARRKQIDRNRQPELYQAVDEVLSDLGATGLLGFFKR